MEKLYETQSATLDPLVSDKKKLIVFNDNINTFRHVIQTLVRICKHSPEQAEQCTWIIHHKGQCTVKEGPVETLKPMCNAIQKAGIKSAIN